MAVDDEKRRAMQSKPGENLASKMISKHKEKLTPGDQDSKPNMARIREMNIDGMGRPK